MRSVVGLFKDYDDSNTAVEALQEAGFSKNLSLLARESVIREPDEPISSDKEQQAAGAGGVEAMHVARSAGAGALGGGAIGGLAGLLVGLSSLAIPGLGPVIAAGILQASLAGIVIGASTGGVLGAFSGLGLSEEEAEAYAEGVKRGGILVVAHASDDKVELAETIMNNAGAIDIEEAVNQWRGSGWDRFDESQDSYLDYPGAWGLIQRQR